MPVSESTDSKGNQMAQLDDGYWTQYANSLKGHKFTKAVLKRMEVEQRRKRFVLLMASDVEIQQLVGSVFPALRPLIEGGIDYSEEAANRFAGVFDGGENNGQLATEIGQMVLES